MVESIMVIPLLALIIGLTFFFGWSLTNQQHVRMSDRYTVWRGAYGGGVSTDSLNQAFFQNKAGAVSITGSSGTGSPALGQLDQAVAGAGRLPQSICQETVAPMPKDMTARVEATFPTSVGLWRQFSGAISDAHSREGAEWDFAHTPTQVQGQPITDVFLQDIDTALPKGNPACIVLQSLYQRKW